MEWLKLIAAVLSGLITAVPLVTALVNYVRKLVREKNWNRIVELTLEYMKTAEDKFQYGTTRKEWVLEMVKTSAAGIEYDLDDAALNKVSAMIDSICIASKVINSPAVITDNASDE